MSAPSAPHIPAGPVINYDTWCVRCGYNLVRIPKSGHCPACGTPIETTLSSNLIAESSPEYTEALRKGVTLVLTAVILQFVLGMIMAGVGMAITIANAPPPSQASSPFQPAPLPLWWTLAFGAMSLGMYAMQAYGLVLFTTFDPAFSGRRDASSSRAWIRNLVLLTVALMVVQMVVAQITTNIIVTVAFAIVALAVWLGLACAQMAYIQWLAPRLPDARVGARAKIMLWLYPLLNTVGIMVCVGPLVAMIMYCMLLNWVRQDLKYLQELRAYEAATAYGDSV